MSSNRNKLYNTLTALLAAGYVWLFFSYVTANSFGNNKGSFCLFKHVTNVPCPSCGSTRSVLSLLKGDFIGSLNLNPLGVMVLLIMIITPLWIISDYVFKKEGLYLFFKKIEETFNKKKVAIPAIMIILLNWIWNINKRL